MRFAVALIVLLAAVGLASGDNICWDSSEGATGYRVYWGTDPTWWTPLQQVETAALCVADPTPEPLPGEIVYFIVTAYNAYGESETEHGEIL